MPTAGWSSTTFPASGKSAQRGADVGGKLVVIGSKLDEHAIASAVRLLMPSQAKTKG